MKLYITRHGTTEWNIARRLQGWGDSKLTDEGIKRAINLGKRLSTIEFDIIYSSPQNRSLETAKLIRGNKDTKIICHDGLKELGFGIWEGMRLDEIEMTYPKEYNTYKTNPGEYVPIDGESFTELFERVNGFLDEIRASNAENVLVVTHGVTVKAIIAIIKGLTLNEFSSLPVFTGTALNICEINGDKMEVILEGDISHIDSGEFDESTM